MGHFSQRHLTRPSDAAPKPTHPRCSPSKFFSLNPTQPSAVGINHASVETTTSHDP